MAKKTKLTPEQEATNELVRRRFRVAKDARRPLDDRFLRYYKLWRSWGDQNEWPDGTPRSSIFVPKTQEAILNVAARSVGSRTKAMFAPREPSDLEKKNVWEQTYAYDWDHTGMDEISWLWFMEGGIYGTNVLQMPWRKEKRTWTEESPLVELGSLKVGKRLVKHSEIAFDGPDPELIDNFNFYPPPAAPYDIQKHAWDIIREVLTLEEFKSRAAKTTVYGDRWKKVEGVAKPPEWPSPIAELESDSRVDPTGTKYVELLHMIENGKLTTIVAGEKEVPPLREQENLYRHGKKHLVAYRFIPDPRRFWGIGLCELLEDLQLELNAIRNQRMDNITLTMNKVLAMREDLLVDPSEAYSAPGNIIRIKREAVSLSEAITVIDIGTVDPASFSEENRIIGDMEGVSGVTSYIKGQDSSSLNDTATGITIVTEQGNVRINMHLTFFEKALAQHAEMDMQLNQQFMPDNKRIRITGKDGSFDWLTVSKNDIAGQFDVIVQAGSTKPVNQQIQVKEAVEIYNQFKGDSDVDQRKLKKIVLEAYGRKDADDLLMQNKSIEDEALQAEDENQQLAGGLMVPVDPSDDHDVHLGVHQDFLAVETPQDPTALQDHIAAHETEMQGQQAAGTLREPSIPPNETSLVRSSGKTNL